MQIELEEVRKRFGRNEALRGVSLTVSTGARVGLVGPNGSGKSTLIRIIMGILGCEGRVALDGRSPFADRREVARGVAYVPQVAPQLGARVDEVIAAVARLRALAPARIGALADALGLELGPIRDRPFRDLSGGMKQKLLIALALAARAQLLILDEPTASLDGRSRELFFRLFQEEARGATLLLCSHRLDEVQRLVGRVAALEEGRVVYDGDAAAYLAELGLAGALRGGGDAA